MTCNCCRGEKTRKTDEVVQLECGHLVCETGLDGKLAKRETVYVAELLRCPICEVTD